MKARSAPGPVAAACAGVLLGMLVSACGIGRTDEQILARAEQRIAAEDLRGATIELKALLQRKPEHARARALLGEVLLASGDAEGAVVELERARERGSPAFETTTLLVRARMAQQRYDAALQELDSLAPATAAQRATAAQLRGSVLFALGRHRDARASFEAALEAEPRSLVALRALAEVAFHLDGLDAAQAVLERALQIDPDDPATWRTAATLYARAGELSQAQQRFDRALELARAAGREREETMALAGLADLELTLGRLDAAGKRLGELEARAPHSGVLKFLRAREAFLTGDFAGARVSLEDILSAQPHNRAAQLLLGAVSFAQGNLEQADMYLANIVAADPHNLFALKLLADTRLRQRKPEAAWDVLAPIVGDATTGGDAKLLALAGSVRMRSGDTAGGLSLLERGVAENPADAEARLTLAAAYVGSDRLEPAIKLLEGMQATESGPHRRELLLMAAYVRNHNPSAALELGDSLLQRRHDDPVLTNVMAALHAAAGNAAAARELFEQAQRLVPSDPAPLVSLGRLDLAENKMTEAQRHFEQALRLAPDDMNAQVAMGTLAAAKGDEAGAVAWFEKARAADARALPPRVLLAQYYVSRADFVRARALAEEAIAIAPQSAAALNVLGVALTASGGGEAGLAKLSEAARRAPGSAAYRFSIAQAHLRAAKPSEALLAAQEALGVDPEYAPALGLVAVLAIERRDFAEAERVLKRLQSVAPRAPATYTVEGDLRMRQEKYPDAVAAYREAYRARPSAQLAMRQFLARQRARDPQPLQPLEDWARLNPNDARSHVMLAEAQRKLGHAAQAATSYERALQLDGRNAVTLNNLAWIYHESGDPRAASTAAKAYELAPKSAPIADTYGWILVQSGQLARGLDLLQEASRGAPGNDDIRYHLAAALAKSGQSSLARQVLDQALRSPQPFAERAAAEELRRTLGGA